MPISMFRIVFDILGVEYNTRDGIYYRFHHLIIDWPWVDYHKCWIRRL